jgi:hypothetical protein
MGSLVGRFSPLEERVRDDALDDASVVPDPAHQRGGVVGRLRAQVFRVPARSFAIRCRFGLDARPTLRGVKLLL